MPMPMTYHIVKTLAVKGLANLANCSQFAKVISNVHDEAHDHTICVAERTRKPNDKASIPYEIKRQPLNDDL